MTDLKGLILTGNMMSGGSIKHTESFVTMKPNMIEKIFFLPKCTITVAQVPLRDITAMMYLGLQCLRKEEIS